MPPQKQKGIRKALKDRVIGSLERTAKLVEKPIKGKKLELEYEDDNLEDEGKNDMEVIMETEEPDRVNVPMQPTALEAARVDIKRQPAQRREEEKTGLECWVDNDVMLADETCEIFLNDMLPVAQ